MKRVVPIIALFSMFFIRPTAGQRLCITHVSLEYISARGISTQNFQSENRVERILEGYRSSGFGLNVEANIGEKLSLETGFRFKEHFLSWRSDFFIESFLVEATYSIPIKLCRYRPFSSKGFFRKIHYKVSGGIILDLRGVDSGGERVVFTSPGFNYTSIYKAAAENPTLAVSFDCVGAIGFNVSKRLNLYIGGGYNQGATKLATSKYTTANSMGVMTWGTAYTRGTYRYANIGLRYSL